MSSPTTIATLPTFDPSGTLERSNDPTSDRVSPTQLWILTGQLALGFCMFMGFGAQRLTPKLLSAGAIVLTIGCYALAPHGRYRRLVLCLPVVGFVWWWLLSGFWTYNTFGFSIETQRNLALVVCVVVLASLLPTEHLVRGMLVQFYFTIAFQYFWTATHFRSSTANYDEVTGFAVPGWHGSFIHKNTMAPYLLFAIVTILIFERRTWLRRGAVAAAMLFVVMSQSATTWSTLSVSLVFLWWFRRLTRQRGRMKPAFVALSACAGVVLLALGALVFPFLLGLYGKDLTFTGRTVIWRGCFRAIREQPWFGYGLGGVWSNPAAQPTKGILSQLGFIVFHAHNGYVELMLQLGIIGLAIWMTIAIGNIVNGVRLLYVHSQVGQWAMIFTIALMMIAMSEVVVFGAWLATLSMMRVVTARELARPHIWHHDLPHDPPQPAPSDGPPTAGARA